MPANLLLSGGRLIDPLHGDDGRFDLRIADGTITKLAPDRLPKGQVVDVSGCLVVPGLIDMHAHHFAGTEPDHYLRNSFHGLPPDGFTLRCGVTTSVDAGSAGWRSFPAFKSQTIDRSITRVLGFLNIVGEGMRGPPLEQDNADMSSEAAAAFAGDNREHVLGFKVAHYLKPDWVPIDNAITAGNSAQLPVMIDFGRSGLSLEELTMHRLRPGDIYTHVFGGGIEGRESIVDPDTGRLRPFVKAAKARGIVWDVGHGSLSFFLKTAIAAAREGFFPDVISTDLHRGSMNGAMKDLLNVMSKFLALGMELNAVIAAVTAAPARVIGRPALGHLGEGAVADVAVLSLREGCFGFTDPEGLCLHGTRRFECELVIKDGRVVYDLNGRAAREVVDVGRIG